MIYLVFHYNFYFAIYAKDPVIPKKIKPPEKMIPSILFRPVVLKLFRAMRFNAAYVFMTTME